MMHATAEVLDTDTWTDDEDDAPPTLRFEPENLAHVLRHMNDVVPESEPMPVSDSEVELGDDDLEQTFIIGPDENRLLLARAFEEKEYNTDDEITLDLPAPHIPSDIPSPLGDSDDVAVEGDIALDRHNDPHNHDDANTVVAAVWAVAATVMVAAGVLFASTP